MVGKGRNDWPVALTAMPANLKIVQLTAEGSGEVVQDNREAIGRAMYEVAGRNGTGAAIPLVPQNGSMIGLDQTVIPQLRGPGGSAREADSLSASRDVCSVGVVRGREPLVFFGLLMGLCLAGRSRRRGPKAGTGMLVWVAVCALVLSACSDDEPAKSAAPDASVANISGALTAVQLRNPESCKECHPGHYGSGRAACMRLPRAIRCFAR